MPQPGTAPSPATSRQVLSPAQIAELPVWKQIARSAEDHRAWLEQVQIELTEIPAPTFHEAARAAYVAKRFEELGLENVRLDEAGNVLAERPGASQRAFVLTAHLDTVVPAGVPIEVRRSNGRIYAPGISDNGAGLAALLGVAAILQRSQVETDLSLILVANVGEEGEGDLYGMRHLLAPGEVRSRVAAMLILDGSAVEHITIAGLGSRRFLIEVTGPGGHSWKDFGRVNPIHALSNIIAELVRIPLSKAQPDGPRTTLNVGVIQGGTTVNTIPGAAWMKVDIRSTRLEDIERVSSALEAAVRSGVEQENQRAAGSLAVRIHQIGERPAAELAMPSRLLDVVRATDKYLGIQSRLERSSTDANIPLSLGIDAVAIAGGGSGGDAHTPNEWYDPQGRDLGLKRILLTTLAMAGLMAGTS
ncbi:MAG: M20/M25/M40 family metallo-hydrolase [Acidobacteria bacterium]|nr:M20/M25/M40 family metallo-hydrolase [Acidobacteriota bacterium]